jgi:hypothetical protein
VKKRLHDRNKPPGKCNFCGRGNLSKEHFWPEWASALLPRYPDNRHVEQTVDAMRVLAQWITLKIMVGERNHPEDAVTPPEDRVAFMSTLEVPPNSRMWIAKCGTGGWETRYVRHAATKAQS